MLGLRAHMVDSRRKQGRAIVDQQVQIKRKLATILAADVAGYTRLMEEDSEDPVAT